MRRILFAPRISGSEQNARNAVQHSYWRVRMIPRSLNGKVRTRTSPHVDFAGFRIRGTSVQIAAAASAARAFRISKRAEFQRPTIRSFGPKFWLTSMLHRTLETNISESTSCAPRANDSTIRFQKCRGLSSMVDLSRPDGSSSVFRSRDWLIRYPQRCRDEMRLRAVFGLWLARSSGVYSKARSNKSRQNSMTQLKDPTQRRPHGCSPK